VSLEFTVIIPARFGSTRLPGKPLRKIGDKSIIEDVYLAATKSNASEIIIATDNEKISSIAQSFGAKVMMTAQSHNSGTERIYEVIEKKGISDNELIINVSGDHFGLEPELINKVANALNQNTEVSIATLCEKITDKDVYQDPNSVKVVVDKNNYALYFSRSCIPWSKYSLNKDEQNTPFLAYKHMGIYAYRAGYLTKHTNLPRTKLEIEESLEQLRVLYHGYKIYVEEISEKQGIEINTEDDLVKARNAYVS